ncbi:MULTISPECIES: Fic family protein [unclassified Endozoicomonas]|uniref:Fic family protein n=1 Tax=unclassified Endozoicomonas TaxID=2644528 RepID=UPI003BB6697C
MFKAPPPEGLNPNVFEEISQYSPEKFGDYLSYYKPLDGKGRYLPFDEFRYRVKKGLDVAIAWSLTKLSRNSQYVNLLPVGEPTGLCSLILTPSIQKTISHTDRNATTAALEWMSSKIGEEQHFEYLLNDLIEDEAISSSQLEGAATTTLVAKDMLKRKRKPRTSDEKMILGNYKMMRFAWDNRDEPLTIDLICDMHRIGVSDIDDDKYTPGVFRQTDDVVVVDSDGETVHTPPSHKGIKKRFKLLCDWINQCHDDEDSSDYLHPLVKAISLHFSIGFEHPFRDGNGRVARSLFYWFMFKNDYAAFRYIAISVLLRAAPVKYGMSYLYTETDDMDLTYFIEYQCGIIHKAINNFKEAYKKALDDIESFNQWIWSSGLYKKLSEKQRVVFQVAKSGTASVFTASSVRDNLGCSYNTASTVLNGLVDLNIFEKKKHGREWLFYMMDKNSIQKKWRTQLTKKTR